MRKGKVVLGALAGLTVGTLMGILFAPAKGSKTRKQIKDKSDEFIDKTKSKFDNRFETFNEKMKQTKNDAQNLAEEGKDKFKDVKNEVSNASKNAIHDVKSNTNRATY